MTATTTETGLEAHGIAPRGRVIHNPTTAQLYTHALASGVGKLAHGGALVVDTGRFTGRSPQDKFIVDEDESRDRIWWGSVNQPLSEQHFDGLRAKVTEHLAGDLLSKPRLSGPDGFNESILGTGFWFLNEEVHSPVDIRQDQADRFDNRIDVMTKTFLGLTVSCARCHDHKFDAISTKDYYALFGFLESSSYRVARFDTMEDEKHLAVKLHGLRDKHRPAFQRAVAEALRPTVAGWLSH